MAMIQVDSAKLRQAANDLEGMNQQLARQMDDLAAKEQNLASKWEGDTKNAFQNAFNSDVTQISAFRSLIDTYIQALRSAADRYDQEEAKNMEIASSRNY